MRDRAVVTLARLPALVALALALVLLVARSSLLSLFPGPGLLVALVAIPLALLPALFAPRSPLPAALAVCVAVLALASYDQSRLDWLRLLKDFGVSHPGAPDWARLALSLAALVLAWAAHATDTALRLRRSAIARGVPEGQAKAASRVSAARTAKVGAFAALGAMAVGGVALGAQALDLTRFLGSQASLLVPLIAVGLIGLAAVLVANR